MSEILLCTLNSRFIHCSFGLRYLLANMGELESRTRIREFTIAENPLDIAEQILAENPKIAGFGVYIWNVRQTESVLRILRRIAPDLKIILGGPDVSHGLEGQPIRSLADHVITGEADLAFAALCRELLGGNPAPEVIAAELPGLPEVRTPYHLYSDEDLAHRVLYVEASRGCPFTCEFCLSSLDIPVRAFPLERFLESMGKLLDRGARHFKFVDRTFNLNLRVSEAILRFFHQRWSEGMFLHFEMIPDRLPERLRKWIAAFPPAALQFEIGIQTFHPKVADRISRRQDYEKLEENLRFLRAETGVHIHADLIVGLPGETPGSFAAGFDRLVDLDPQEIQVGMLKLLKGTPISRHDEAFGMVYGAEPPFEILRNRDFDFAEMQRMRRFARFWDLVANSGNFIESTPLLWGQPGDSPFGEFMAFSEWLYQKTGRSHRISLTNLCEYLFEYLAGQKKLDPGLVAPSLLADYRRAGRRDTPIFLREFLEDTAAPQIQTTGRPRRQERHAGRPRRDSGEEQGGRREKTCPGSREKVAPHGVEKRNASP